MPLNLATDPLGATHPNTASCLDNLAELYRIQGKYDEAELLYQRALAICEQEWDGAHPLCAPIEARQSEKF
jgi:tetratricopeptide (TPR) repeat protein